MNATLSIFEPIIQYINSGLPPEHWFVEMSVNVGKRRKIWLDWNDADQKHEYETYPADIKYAARFRDALVSDLVPVNFGFYFENYKEQSEKVYRYLFRHRTTGELCREESHPIERIPTSITEFPKGVCVTASAEIDLMDYHIDNVEGYQSQSLMRGKVCIIHSQWFMLSEFIWFDHYPLAAYVYIIYYYFVVFVMCRYLVCLNQR